MDALIRWSIRHRVVVAALSVAWFCAGVFFALRAPLDVFPEFVPPQVTIQTEAAGFAPEQVEQIVTRPIEAAVNGAPGVESLRSEFVYGLSVVVVSFESDVDPVTIRQGISERLGTLAGELPMGVAQPKLTPLTSSTMDVLKFGLLSNSVDPYTLRDIADWTVNPHLLALPGIARVTVYGGAIRQVQIQPNLDRLAGLGLSINDVMEAGRSALALRGGGTVDTRSQRITLDAPPPAPDPQAIAQALVSMQDNMPITIGQVANVTIGPAVPIGDATIMGRPGVLVTVSSQFGANTLKATEAVERALEDLKPALERRGIDIILLHRPASFIERALSNLEHALALGSALILIVLYAFLRSWKAALISFLAIPLSLLAAIFVLAQFGQTLNTMTLGGFALALGVLVDDAIIDIENIMRRLRLAKAAGRDDDLQTIEEASIEIRGSMLYGTLAVIFVFLPILFAGGVQGRFIGPMALTFIIAVLASMVVALTVTPALSALMLTGEETKELPRLVTLMQGLQAWCMEKVRTHWGLTVAALAGAAAAAIAVAPFLHSELIPQFREGHFVIQMTAAAQGTSVGDISATGVRISNELLKLPFVRSVGHQIGRAEAGEDTWSPDKSEFHVELTSEHDETETEAQEKIRDVLEHFPEVRTEAMTFLGDRISETLSGETAQVVINLTGTEIETLESSAEVVQKAIAGVEGVEDLRIPKAAKVPTMAIRLNRTALANYGLTAQDALDNVQTAFAGTTIGQTYVGAQTVDVVVILPPEQRDRIEQLSNLLVGNSKTTRAAAQRCLHRRERRALHHSARRRAAARQCELQRRIRPLVAGYRRRGERPRRRLAAAGRCLRVLCRSSRGRARRPDPARYPDGAQHRARRHRSDDGIHAPRLGRRPAYQRAVLPHRRHGGDRRQRRRPDARQPRRARHGVRYRRAQLGDDAGACRAPRRPGGPAVVAGDDPYRRRRTVCPGVHDGADGSPRSRTAGPGTWTPRTRDRSAHGAGDLGRTDHRDLPEPRRAARGADPHARLAGSGQRRRRA